MVMKGIEVEKLQINGAWHVTDSERIDPYLEHYKVSWLELHK
jgi:hypothetical protein